MDDEQLDIEPLRLVVFGFAGLWHRMPPLRLAPRLYQRPKY
jgi:hypothetical protein